MDPAAKRSGGRLSLYCSIVVFIDFKAVENVSDEEPHAATAKTRKTIATVARIICKAFAIQEEYNWKR